LRRSSSFLCEKFGKLDATGDCGITEEKILEYSHRLQSPDLLAAVREEADEILWAIPRLVEIVSAHLKQVESSAEFMRRDVEACGEFLSEVFIQGWLAGHGLQDREFRANNGHNLLGLYVH
jgi:hypothetical protein